jgi:hypothetical protein
MSVNNTSGRGSPLRLAIGMVGGGVVGFAVWMITGLFVYLPVFIACGFVVGYAATESHGRS